MTKIIEKYIRQENWKDARKAIQAGLTDEPDDHWLLTRLSLTYFEQHKYTRALRYSEQALTIAPACPLVLWDYASVLNMLNREIEAIQIYHRLIRRGISSIASDECGEGELFAKSLVADCHYCLALCYLELDQPRKAESELQIHLKMRADRCRSIYPISEIKKTMKRTRNVAA